MIKKTALIFSLLLTASISLSGQSLYGSGISPDSALVRVIFAGSDSNLKIEIGAETFSASEPEKSAPYHQISPGMYFIGGSDDFLEIMPMSGKYYTLIFTETGSFVFEDIEHDAPAKSQVYFYNCYGETASLLVSGTGDPLFSQIPPGESVQRAVNPLKTGFALKAESGKNLELGPLPMSRGGSTSVILFERHSSPASMVLVASVMES
ncbi:MAG: alginate O-acetyltransferase AlgF [Spirochaetales bacterium]|nr:alginate O-acetyltransferase AlgF [Spirochaetales bacterium]